MQCTAYTPAQQLIDQEGVIMPRLTLQLFGFPRLERDGEPVHIGRRKASALLAYVVVTASKNSVSKNTSAKNNAQVSRDTLAALLWPEYDQSRARADLRRMLSLLNKILGKGILVTDRETVGLHHDANLKLDVIEFCRLIALGQQHDHPPNDVCQDCLPALEKAVARYQDDFLAGFTLIPLSEI